MTDGWIGPAVIAAIVSAIVTAGGWFVTHSRERGAEERRRREKIIDVQKALRAEIGHHVAMLEETDLEAHLAVVKGMMAGDEAYFPIPPREAHDSVYRALLHEIHVLPTETVDPVVAYYAQIGAIATFAEDLRERRFRALPRARRELAYEHFIGMKLRALRDGREACRRLEAGIGALASP